jgi:hypothetical protein
MIHTRSNMFIEPEILSRQPTRSLTRAMKMVDQRATSIDNSIEASANKIANTISTSSQHNFQIVSAIT